MEDQDLKTFIKGYEHGYWLKRVSRKELDDILGKTDIHLIYQYGVKLGSRTAAQEKARKLIERGIESSKNR